jgi:uncharacterized membrane protein YeaQ/YmgE (transglycosylase-associated protein family)
MSRGGGVTAYKSQLRQRASMVTHEVATGVTTEAALVALRSQPPFSQTLSEEIAMGIMGIIWMIVVGFIVGLLARFFYPGAIALGFWMTALLGIGGSLVGGVIGSLIWKSPDGKFHPAGFILSIVGALILLWLYLNFMK